VCRLFACLVFGCCLGAQSLFIDDVTVIDVTTGSARKADVVIRKGTISATAPRVVRPRGVPAVNGKGKFLIPGLWDMHVHLWDPAPMFELYLANGVTGIRDMGSPLERTLLWQEQIRTGKRPGPVVVTSGPVIDGPGQDAGKLPVVRAITPVQARAAVDRLDNGGADFIKVASNLSEDAYRALAERVRLRRATFAGHVPEAVSAWRAVDARQRSIEHLFGIAMACSPIEPLLRQARAEALAKKDYAELRRIRDRIFSTFSESICRELFGRMNRYGTWQTPTLTLRKRLALLGIRELVESPQVTLVPANVRSTWEDPMPDLERTSPEESLNYRQDYEFQQRLVALMNRSNVGILAGTDTGDPFVLPGFALHDELELLVEAGLTPAEALRTATVNPARFFNQENQRGEVKRGHAADLVLLDANPLADIRNTRRIFAVVRDGRLLDRKALDRMLKR
jgi:hypothetical protein